PGLHLAAAQLAAVQQAVEGMQDVVARRADLAQRGLQAFRRQRLRQRRGGFGAQERSSMPSQATSQPARSSSARSGESSSNAGLELLMCTNTLRRTPSPANAAMLPSLSLMLMCPIRLPVLLPRPAAIISSSRHKVPSNNTRAAPRKRCARDSVIAAQPG